MHLQSELDFDNITVQQLQHKLFDSLSIQLNVLRLDKLHPVVSGNKWFKLKYWLQKAIEKGYMNMATFGGAFSNHILATAYACNKLNINCVGFIRGKEPKLYSQTLLDAKALGMQFEFTSRHEYANRHIIMQSNNSLFYIPEGGYGIIGAKGAAEIVQLVTNYSTYDYIVCAVGTGTMLAGIANAGLPHQRCIGISVMKNNFIIENEVFILLNKDAKDCVQLLQDYHFGGYAKFNQRLIDFMNYTWLMHNLPLDFVYTAKALYAVYDLAEKNYFPSDSNILFIHSGGLQGNHSLGKGTLKYA